MTTTATAAATAPCVLAFSPRERTRAVLRAAFPRRKGRLLFARTAADFEQTLKTTLVDAAVVDVGTPHESSWTVAECASDFPSVPFFGVAPLRVAEGPALAYCAAHDFVDVLVDVVDEDVMRDLLIHQSFTARFARALNDPPSALALDAPVQRAVWRYLVGAAGRPVRTATLAEELKISREHLSRSFSTGNSPNLKRVIDLVRLMAAAELSKNPGHDVRDVAMVLGFASASHLSTTSQRIAGTKPASLARLRTIDLVERFVHGHGRSRG